MNNTLIDLLLYRIFERFFFNLETSNQLTSFFGNELLWGRKDSIKDLDSHLKYWNNLKNFKEIINYLSRDNFTLIANAK